MFISLTVCPYLGTEDLTKKLDFFCGGGKIMHIFVDGEPILFLHGL